MFEYINQLIPILQRRIQEYHSMFELPLIAEQWEEVLHRSFEEIGLHTTWKPNRSHKVGEDMRIKGIDNSRISCKSGTLKNNRSLGTLCVRFSGARCTSCNTLDEKLEYLSKSHDDYYFLLSKISAGSNKKFNKKYKLIVFESPICQINQLSWTEHLGGKQWIGRGPFEADISKVMSSQLWTTLPLNLIEHIYDINCNED